MDASQSRSYHRTTTYLTDDSGSGSLGLPPKPGSRINPVRQRRDPLRLDQPPGAPSEEELREAVIRHVHSEAKLYPDAPEGDCHPIQPRMHQAPDRW